MQRGNVFFLLSTISMLLIILEFSVRIPLCLGKQTQPLQSLLITERHDKSPLQSTSAIATFLCWGEQHCTQYSRHVLPVDNLMLQLIMWMMKASILYVIFTNLSIFAFAFRDPWTCTPMFFFCSSILKPFHSFCVS